MADNEEVVKKAFQKYIDDRILTEEDFIAETEENLKVIYK